MASKAKIGGDIKDALTRDLVNACASLGYKAGLDAYRNHTYKHRTYGLHDSYGSAVYLNGALVPETIRYINRSRQKRSTWGGWRASTDPENAKNEDYNTGRKALDAYFREHSRLNKRKGITILVVAAQYYAMMVEGKGYAVLNPRTLYSSFAYNFDTIVGPVLDKYGVKKFAPTLKRELGVDQFFIQDQMARLKPYRR